MNDADIPKSKIKAPLNAFSTSKGARGDRMNVKNIELIRVYPLYPPFKKGAKKGQNDKLSTVSHNI